MTTIGGSGGVSSCTTPSGQSSSSCSGGYAKPSWQTGTGVPNDRKRDVPDVSLFSADGLNDSFYVVCQNASCADGDYRGVILIGGTSAAAPEFAGIMALVNQKMQSRQGLANYTFYPLSARPGATCNSTGTLDASCIFYDVTAGTNATPCATGTPDCMTNTNGDQNGVLSGYNTTVGYDLATGLGSVNVTNLVNNWSSVSFQPTVSTLSLNPTTQITHGAPVNLNLSVTPTVGSGVPTGSVSLLTSAGPAAGTFTLGNGSVSATTSLLPGGNYTVTAYYAGDGTYASSDSSPGIPVSVTSEPSATTLQAFTLDQNGNMVPYSSGTYGASVIYLRTTVAGQSGQGVPTRTVNLSQTINGVTTNLPGNPYALNSEGYTMTPLPGGYYNAFTPGTYSFAAKYSGDVSFNSSVSSATSFTVNRAPTNTTTTFVDCTPVNGVCVFGANSLILMFGWVGYSNSDMISQQPTGTATFFSNGIALSPPVTIDSGIVPPNASFSTTQLLGQNNITVQYSGDLNYLGSTSAATLIQVGETFALSASPISINVASAGQSGSTTLTFTAQNAFTGSTTLSPSMCSSLPPKSTCSFSPTTVSFTSSTTSVPVTLTIGTSANSSVTSWRLPRSWLGSREIAIAFIMTTMCLVFANVRGRHRTLVYGLIALTAVALELGCGGSGATGSLGGGGIPGTPAGNYSGVTVTVTINGVTQSINNLTVNVN